MDADVLRGLFERRGADAFAQIVGDWAISFVCRARREESGSREPGLRRYAAAVLPRPEFFGDVVDDSGSAAVDLAADCPLVRGVSRRLADLFPEAHRTPYRDIFSVPPASFVRITPDNVTVQTYWRLESAKPVRLPHRSSNTKNISFPFSAKPSGGESVRRAHSRRTQRGHGLDFDRLHGGFCRFREAGFPKIDTVTYFDPNGAELG